MIQLCEKTIKRAGLVLLTVLLAFQSCGDYFDVGNNPNLVEEPTLVTLLGSVTHRAGWNSYRYGSAASSYVQYTASSTSRSATGIYDIIDLSTSWSVAYYGMCIGSASYRRN